MHTAVYLDRSMFSAEICGEETDLGAVLPAWQAHDRLGVVVHEPYGFLGASLAIQAATTMFYDVRPQRRAVLAQYPEIYLLHVGGPHGDGGVFDFNPPRHELVLVPDAAAIVAALNDRGITRLLVPDEPASPAPEVVWHELHPLRERVSTVLAYSASGEARGADVVLRGRDSGVEWNPSMTLDPDRYLEQVAAMAREELAKFDPTLAADKTLDFDLDSYADYVRGRASEVPEEIRRQLRQRRQAGLQDGCPTESYRRTTVDQALRRLVP